MVRAIQRAFPRMCEGRAEDAVDAATLALIERQGPAGPAEADERLLFRIAWREARGQLRRHGYQRELGGVPLHSIAQGGQDIEGELIVADLVYRLVPRAAAAFGGRRTDALRDALRDRLQERGTDTDCAAEHGVPREYLNRAKRWLGVALRA